MEDKKEQIRQLSWLNCKLYNAARSIEETRFFDVLTKNDIEKLNEISKLIYSIYNKYLDKHEKL